jgi:hypothetical protein
MRPTRYRYYHRSVRDFFAFVVPPDQDVLVAGEEGESDLGALHPKRGVVLYPGEERSYDESYESHSLLKMESLQGQFDYIILKNVLGVCQDIGSFLGQLSRHCHPHTRILVYHYNYLWKPWLRLAEWLSIKRAGGLDNWLSIRDVDNAMTAAGFQRISVYRRMLFPWFLLGLGFLLNMLGKFLFFMDWAKLNQFQIFRPLPKASPSDDSVTICLTCRDERENIEPIVAAIPKLCDQQEILFVEGHSQDGTREEIERVSGLYPEKNIRVIGQPGKGQGDAIREGFLKAKGCILILLESDQTSPPENVEYVYQSIRNGYAEFIEGSRFVYPLSRKTMPLLNQIGNWGFAYFFSWLFGQHLTDVLSGIKAIRKSDFEKILARWNQWGINDPFGDFELLFGAVRLGLKSAEQPIHYRPRPYGTTKTKVFFHGKILAKMAVRAFFQFRG